MYVLDASNALKCITYVPPHSHPQAHYGISIQSWQDGVADTCSVGNQLGFKNNAFLWLMYLCDDDPIPFP